MFSRLRASRSPTFRSTSKTPTPSCGWTSAARRRSSSTSSPVELGLHELAVEDALGPHQRPKLDRYATHLFLSCHAVRVDVEAGGSRRDRDRRVHQRALADHRPQERRLLDRSGAAALGSLARPRRPRGELPALRPARRHRRQLLRRGPVLRRVLRRGQRRDLLRPSARSRPNNVTGSRCAAPWSGSTAWSCPCARRSAASCGASTPPSPRSSTPTSRTCTTTSCASASPPIRSATSSSTIVETNLSLRDYRQNLIVKKVSSWAAIIAVPALVTGYYGMNVPYPGFRQGLGCRRLHRLDGGWHDRPVPAVPPHRLAVGASGPYLVRRFEAS